MVYDFTMLRSKITKIFGKQENFAKALGITRPALTMKLCNKRPFSIAEIENSVLLLNIPRAQIHEYFFALDVRLNGTDNGQ